jgi:hypothetical protein
MARSCLEGPVFDGAAIAWGELGHPPASTGGLGLSPQDPLAAEAAP